MKNGKVIAVDEYGDKVWIDEEHPVGPSLIVGSDNDKRAFVLDADRAKKISDALMRWHLQHRAPKETR